MGLVSLLQKQVESRAQVICEQRNKSLPAELGKALSLIHISEPTRP